MGPGSIYNLITDGVFTQRTQFLQKSLLLLQSHQRNSLPDDAIAAIHDFSSVKVTLDFGLRLLYDILSQ